jgi:hypothetical protein
VTDDLERAFAADDARADRRFVVLTTLSVLCGVGAFAVTLWMSSLLVPVDGRPVEIGAAVILSGILFVALVPLCIVLGYVAARGRTRRSH